ncbi:tumor protein p63-regulated gene 1-like protein [Chelonus insularis]|uniref:tumor protein p63-regulated gene 1-like protein n=1 Tax=Chelonus insularis TaxID=460826 RepID=UPI00158F3AAA|nr:tumor protein p63-regulated gene 1-like protein [Chelonus insularis]
MLDHNQLDEIPTMNFEAATLRMSKEVTDTETKDDIYSQENNNNAATAKTNILSIPFKHIDVHTFFSDRNEVVERAIKECQETLSTDQNDEIVGTWLLTEISLWDTEKERMVLLTKNALFSIKYDFISLKIREFHRVPLAEIDKIAYGELEYPAKSVVPRLNGFAEGLSSAIHCAVRQQWSSITSRSEINFEPKKRNMFGVRLMWNKGKPLSFDKKWNPFAKHLPMVTYASHPLYWHKDSNDEKTRFDVDDFYAVLKNLLIDRCEFISTPLIVENYVGLGALLHNRNSLGFFKVRGRVSF